MHSDTEDMHLQMVFESQELHNGERQPFYNDKSGNSGIVRFSVPDTQTIQGGYYSWWRFMH